MRAMMEASVVFPQPGGPQKMLLCSRSASMARRSSRARPQKPLLPHKFVKRAGPHALGQRRQGGAFLQAAE